MVSENMCAQRAGKQGDPKSESFSSFSHPKEKNSEAERAGVQECGELSSQRELPG